METIFLSIYLTTIIYTLLYINLPIMHGDDYKGMDYFHNNDWVE